MSRLTNGAPARVFHQGPQLARCTMTGCSLAVRTLVLFDRFGRHTAGTSDSSLMVASRLHQGSTSLDTKGSPCSDIGDNPPPSASCVKPDGAVFRGRLI